MPKLNYGMLNSVQLKSVKAKLSQLNSATLNCEKLGSGRTLEIEIQLCKGSIIL